MNESYEHVPLLEASKSAPPSWPRWEVSNSRPEEWFWFEKLDDVEWWFWFYERIWFPASLLLVSLYLVGVIGVKWWMEGRKPLKNVATPLTFLLLGNALFAIMCGARLVPRAWTVFNQPDGVYRLLCTRNEPLAYEFSWALWYTLVKPIHLMETFLIILAKRKLSVFHVFHHSIMVLMPAVIAPFGEPFIYFQMCVNSLQHSVTYPLMASRSMNLRLFKGAKVLVLLMELVDMTLGVLGTTYTLYVIRNGQRSCLRHPTSIAIFNFAITIMFLLIVKMLVGHVNKKRLRLQVQKMD